MGRYTRTSGILSGAVHGSVQQQVTDNASLVKDIMLKDDNQTMMIMKDIVVKDDDFVNNKPAMEADGSRYKLTRVKS